MPLYGSKLTSGSDVPRVSCPPDPPDPVDPPPPPAAGELPPPHAVTVSAPASRAPSSDARTRPRPRRSPGLDRIFLSTGPPMVVKREGEGEGLTDADARVDHRVQQVNDEVDRQEDRHDQQQRALDHRVVAAVERGVEQAAETWVGEDDL